MDLSEMSDINFSSSSEEVILRDLIISSDRFMYPCVFSKLTLSLHPMSAEFLDVGNPEGLQRILSKTLNSFQFLSPRFDVELQQQLRNPVGYTGEWIMRYHAMLEQLVQRFMSHSENDFWVITHDICVHFSGKLHFAFIESHQTILDEISREIPSQQFEQSIVVRTDFDKLLTYLKHEVSVFDGLVYKLPSILTNSDCTFSTLTHPFFSLEGNQIIINGIVSAEMVQKFIRKMKTAEIKQFELKMQQDFFQELRMHKEDFHGLDLSTGMYQKLLVRYNAFHFNKELDENKIFVQ
ncbi:Hypothetical_protein [Hexamita inflata]|uniref:Hypothetical_protein n=1 Tax=Hexamita inflata TaxID=28002 RepID=A0AA86Q1W6_9EUKA|nr:Hypothetical protein HINF_LOCUS38254 [Hexamita inflata]